MSINKIYNRTSTEDQCPENQLKDCVALAKRLKIDNWDVLEEQKSAFKDDYKRNEFNKILKEIQKGQIKVLIVWDLDRIYRNRQKLVGFFKLCKSYDCEIYSVRQTFLNEIQNVKLPEGFNFIKDMMVDNFIQFLGWIAEDESKKKSDRVKLAVRKAPGKITKSYKGNKWGRKSISTQKKNRIFEAMENNPKLSLRSIAKEFQVSIGTVHKLSIEFKKKEPSNLSVQELVN